MIRASLEALLAAFLIACAVVSILYSPAAIWAVLTLDPSWRMELLGPQVARVPVEIRAITAVWFSLAAGCLFVRNAEVRTLMSCACALSAAAITAYWLTTGSLTFM